MTYQEWAEERCRTYPCDLCGGDAGEVHHIARGQNRQLALTAVFATLVLCDACHRYWAHRGGKIAEQLARLKYNRPLEYDIEKFYQLTDRRWPDEEEIEAAYLRITDHDRSKSWKRWT